MARRGDYYAGIDPNRLPSGPGAGPIGRPAAASNPFLGAPVGSQGGSSYNPLLDPTGGFARSTKLGGLISGLFGNGMTRQDFQQQQQNTLQAQAMQFVADRAQKVGAQPAILSLIQSDIGQQLMVSGGNFDSIAEVANLAASGKVREARAKAFGQSSVSQPTAQPAAVEGDQWAGMRSAGEELPVSRPSVPGVTVGQFDYQTGDATHWMEMAQELFAANDEKGAEHALKMAGQALAIEQSRRAATTNDLREYQFYVSQRKAAGEEPMQFYDWDLARRTASGGGGESELMKQLGKTTGEQLGELQVQGRKAAGLKQDLEALSQLIELAPQGLLQGGKFGIPRYITLPSYAASFTDAGQAFDSIIKRVAPSLRVEGSGSTSDMEMSAFLDSLPSLGNQPEANRFIVAMLKAKAELDMERSAIVDMMATKEIDLTEGRKRLNALNAKSIMTPELRSAMVKIAQGTDPVSRERNRGPDAGSVGGGRGGGGGGGW